MPQGGPRVGQIGRRDVMPPGYSQMALHGAPAVTLSASRKGGPARAAGGRTSRPLPLHVGCMNLGS
jgi:hypothetical protein